MTTIARIVDGIVVDIRVSPEFTPPDGQTWVECPTWVQPRSLYNGGVWRRPDGQPYSDAEMQTVATQLSIWQSLTSAERRALWSMADLEGPVGDTALLILGALMSATETESRNPATKQLIGAAMQLGIVADLERARVILNDPGFTLE